MNIQIVIEVDNDGKIIHKELFIDQPLQAELTERSWSNGIPEEVTGKTTDEHEISIFHSVYRAEFDLERETL